MIPSSLRVMLLSFKSCFTKPGYKSFIVLAVGWVVCLGRHTISRVIQAAGGQANAKHHSTLYRFFSQGAWRADDVSRQLFRLLLPRLPEVILAVGDDTLCHRSGPRLFGGGMHHDAAASSYGRGTSKSRHAAFAFGHSWVVLGLWLPLPWDGQRGMVIPLLFRLYRSRRTCPESLYRKRTELFAELVRVIIGWLPEWRKLHLVTDHEYACRTVVKSLPKNVVFTGPMPKDAALHLPVGAYRGVGRPRVKGKRLPSPEELAKDRSRRWKRVMLEIYGREVTMQTKSIRCTWPTVAGSRMVRVVRTRDPKGLLADRTFFCTDPASSIDSIIVTVSRRWQLEVAFRNAKQSMGLEDAQNGWWRRARLRRRTKKKAGPQAHPEKGRKAVEHTTPFGFIIYGLVALWYLEHGEPDRDVADARLRAPWYVHKATPSFVDMLAALRREIWIERLSKNPLRNRGRKKLGRDLPGWLLAG